MRALLGKITKVTGQEGTPSAFEIGFKTACVLPERGKVPEWLADQTLTVRRSAPDPREIGGPGDTLVLTPEESAFWLYPLAVSPEAAYGALPDAFTLALRWWKDDKPPEWTVRANGRVVSGTFEKQGEGWAATVETAPFFPFPPTLPVVFDVSCDKLKAACTVLPAADTPGARKLLLTEREIFRAENAWYVVDVTARRHAGGIAALRERGRGVDHFHTPANLIQHPLEHGGHIDRYRMGWRWAENLRTVEMSCAGARREGGATRLVLEGVADEGQNLRTTVAYTLPDDLPLVLLQRDFHRGKAKKDDGDKKDENEPREPIDEMQAMGVGFRAAAAAERDGSAGSRVLCGDGRDLVVARPARAGEWMHYSYWRMTDGWVALEHPGRREVLLYLFERENAPELHTQLGDHSIVLESGWTHRPVRPESSLGFSLALAAGELCGASAAGDARPEGVWVATRTTLPHGGVRCAVIARLRALPAGATATFTLAGETREAPLRGVLLPGVGEVACAVAEFSNAGLDDPFDVTAAGIPARR